MRFVTFEEFLSDLTDLSGPAVQDDPAMRERIQQIVTELRGAAPITRESLASFLKDHPDAVLVLATCCGLGHEQLSNQLKRLFNTSGWVQLARRNADRLVAVLDEEFQLVSAVQEQLNRNWSFADVLLERYLWSRKRAARAVGQGRTVEDEVEQVVQRVGLRYVMRTQFTGRGGRTAPCDMAILNDRDEAVIVLAAKGFNSTGSKLTDAVREIEQMADVRLAFQYVYTLIDGIGWVRRQADLRRIYNLWERKLIDGLYTLKHLPVFEEDLIAAARRTGLLDA